MKNPFYAVEYGAPAGNLYPPAAHLPAFSLEKEEEKGEKEGASANVGEKAAKKDAELNFLHFVAVMHSLCYFGCPKKNLRPWAKFQDFARLYYAVKANMVDCTTMVTNTK